ncbi:MAG: hypothetical protein ACRDJ4_02240 [Actinomycetota bacterium]
MPRCPCCQSPHIVIRLRPYRRGHCRQCGMQWSSAGEERPLDAALAGPFALATPPSGLTG